MRKHQFCRSQHDHEQIVEIVCHTPGQQPYRIELLNLMQFPFALAQFIGTLLHEGLQVVPVFLERPFRQLPPLDLRTQRTGQFRQPPHSRVFAPATTLKTVSKTGYERPKSQHDDQHNDDLLKRRTDKENVIARGGHEHDKGTPQRKPERNREKNRRKGTGKDVYAGTDREWAMCFVQKGYIAIRYHAAGNEDGIDQDERLVVPRAKNVEDAGQDNQDTGQPGSEYPKEDVGAAHPKSVVVHGEHEEECSSKHRHDHGRVALVACKFRRLKGGLRLRIAKLRQDRTKRKDARIGREHLRIHHLRPF